MSRKRILILFHENSTRLSIRNSLVLAYVPVWKSMGHGVEVQFGINSTPNADLVFVHIDMSVVPKDYLEFANQFPVSINARVADIRKSSISNNLLCSTDSWSGPVVVKSNLNFGGWPEYLIDYPSRFGRNANTRYMLGKTMSAIGVWRKHVPNWTRTYRIFDDLTGVPKEVFLDDKLVVEKFLPETDNDYFCMRMFQCLGDRHDCLKLYSKNPFIKYGEEGLAQLIEPHPEILRFREKLSLDYGKIDYVVHNGVPHVLDVNKTVGTSGGSKPDKTRIE